MSAMNIALTKYLDQCYFLGTQLLNLESNRIGQFHWMNLKKHTSFCEVQPTRCKTVLTNKGEKKDEKGCNWFFTASVKRLR